MKDYRTLSKEKQQEIDDEIFNEIDPNKTFKFQDSEYNLKEYTINNVHSGYYCADCWRAYYNCLCSHED